MAKVRDSWGDALRDNSGADYTLFYKGLFQKGAEMKKAFLFLFITPLVLVNLLGCWFIAGSAVGAVGAYAVGKDTVQGKTDKPYDSLWNAALTVSRIRGTIKIEDGAKGYIELEAESSRTWIRLIRLTRTATRLRISCRKHKLPNLALAEDLFAKIMEEAR